MTEHARTRKRRDALLALAIEHGPCSVRHVYYQAVVAGLVPKNDDAAAIVGLDLTKLRKDGRLSWDLIVDDSRSGHLVDEWADPVEFVDDAMWGYRHAVWGDDSPRVELWCESRSIASPLLDIAAYWRIACYPMNGQTSWSLVHKAVKRWKTTPHRQPVILYVGDHDPAGLEIEGSLIDKFAYFAADSWEGIDFQRIGVTRDQAERYDLPGTPPKFRGKKASTIAAQRAAYPWPVAVEAEALPPALLRQLIIDELTRYVTPAQLEEAERIEDEEREAIVAFLWERRSA